MRSYLSAITVLIVLLFASDVRGQALWHGTEYGMTLEQAKAHVPDAVRPVKPKHRSDGAEELLRLDDVTLVGKRFSASFFFSDGKLKEVSLSLEEGHDFESAMRVFDSLVEDLRAKHGHEIIRQTMKGSFSNTANATWVSGQTTITLFATSVGENDTTLNINYQVRPPRRLMTHNLPSNSEVKAKCPHVAETPLTNVFRIEAPLGVGNNRVNQTLDERLFLMRLDEFAVVTRALDGTAWNVKSRLSGGEL